MTAIEETDSNVAVAASSVVEPSRKLRRLVGRAWLWFSIGLSLLVVSAYYFGLLANLFLLAELVNSLQLQLAVGLAAAAVCLTLALRYTCRRDIRSCAIQCRMPCSSRRRQRLLRRWLWFVVFTAAWSGYRVLGVYLPSGPGATGAQALRVMSFNVLGTNENDQAIVDEIRRVSPDVVLVWELTYRNARKLEALRDEYPFGLERPHYYYTLGFGVYSKRPIIDQRVAWLSDTLLSCPIPEFRIRVGDNIVRIIGIHASNPVHGATWGIRNRQLQRLAQIVREATDHTIVVGDFNCTPYSPAFRSFLQSSGLSDTRRGQGIHNSWPAPFAWFGVPIDHIFVTSEIGVVRRFLGRPAGSDHLPVYCDVALP